MTLEESIQKLEENKILDLKNIEYIHLGRLKTIIFAEFNIELSILKLREYMSHNELFIEISKNFFVAKGKLKELVKGLKKEEYKSYLEDRYIVQVDGENIFFLLNEEERKYEDLLRFGLDNSYIDNRWLNSLDIESTDFSDVYEVIAELESIGIKIK